jgi:hypothetical protein
LESPSTHFNISLAGHFPKFGEDPSWQRHRAIIFRSAAFFTEAARMIENRNHLDQWKNAFDRRSIGRTTICKGALLFFSETSGVHSCTVRDITNLGAGIRIAQDLKIVPLDFALSFDHFRTIRMCRLVWRQDDFLGVVFES